MIIAVDAMGGDLAPEQIVHGALCCPPHVGADLALVGQPDQVRRYLPADHQDRPELKIVAASGVVGMEDDLSSILRNGCQSSLAVAVEMVRTGEADAAVSAGNSGAFMALAYAQLGTIAGVRRPAIAVVLPSRRQAQVLIDGGANVDCQPVHLAQFAVMGSIYAQHALQIDRPRVGLLSIGREPSKGNDLTRAAYELLRESPLDFIGNVEGDDMLGEDVDVIVADGFAGNVALKAAEGMARWATSELDREIAQSVWARLGALLMRRSLAKLRKSLDYATYGGALLLGVRGICVVSHGRSDARAISNALSVAHRAVNGQIVQRLQHLCGKLMPAATS